MIRSDGEIRWVLAHGEARFATIDGAERAYRYTGTIQDITERKLAEARLLESESRLRLAVEAARLGVWQYDRETDQVQSTPDLNRILGYPEDQKLDVAEIRSRYFPGDQQRLREAGEAAMARGDRYFQTEYRFRRPDETIVWLLLRAEILMGADGAPRGALGVLIDITDRKAAEEQRKLAFAELRHRVRNTLGLVGAMATQTLRDAAAPEALRLFMDRLNALANAHDILIEENWRSADCREVVERSLAPHRTGQGQIKMSGPSLRLSARQALALALALNELATNAAKYGALLGPGGRIEISWGVAEKSGGREFHFDWAEHGGPPVVPPLRSGFGSRIIRENLAAEFSGSVSVDFLPGGLHCRLTAAWPG
jgi:PAS domain S-box-containing protein